MTQIHNFPLKCHGVEGQHAMKTLFMTIKHNKRGHESRSLGESGVDHEAEATVEPPSKITLHH